MKDIDGKLALLSRLEQTGLDLDETLVLLLEDSSKKVVDAASRLLVPRVHLKPKIRALLDSKKKPVRTAALRVLEMMEDA